MKVLTPRPYQILIRDQILLNPRTAVWSFMGSGKTAATLLAIDILQTFGGGPALVVAPKLVAETVWVGETQKWSNLSHLRVSCIVGDLGRRVRALQAEADVYTVNFEQLIWLTEYLGDKWPFETVVIDESSKLRGFRGSIQTSKLGKKFLRTGGTKSACALAKVAFGKVKRFIELTGTPAPNGLKNLWGQLWFLDQGERLGNCYDAFTQRWYKVGYDGYTLEPYPHSEKEITDLCADLCFALEAKDWFDLKDPIVTNIFVDLPKKARAAYDEMEKDFYTEINQKGVDAANAAVKSGKLLQITNGAIYTEDKKIEEIHDEKITALKSVFEEACGMPVLVVYQYTHDLKRLLKAFPQGKALDGKPSTVNAWNRGEIPIMFLHAASAGHGNNFQDGGNIMVCFGLGWDLELYSQVLERIGPVRQRQSGYDRPVYTYHILARGTIDEVVLERLETKRAVQDLLTEKAARYHGRSATATTRGI